MASHPTDKLNDKEFEELCRDILQLELKKRFETFRSGKDCGIDLRYSTDEEESEIIVQAKQYKKSGYRKLLEILKKEELPKVKLLDPKRYILMTSVPLNIREKEEIRKIFDSYISNTGDIFGEDDLNNSIERFPQLLKSHIKLTLTSMNVLGEILNSHIRSRSVDKIKEIQNRIHLFVQNDKYKEAIKIINDEHFLIITGAPGIGKTSLAEFITYQHLKDGFMLTFILSDLTDAEKMMETESKVIFYFDDFLGANYLRIKQDAHQDSRLVNLINRVKTSNSKRLILTTRTTILNQARNDFEKLKERSIDLSRHEIHISDYNEFQKAQILYNHIYHSNLDSDFVENFMVNKSYKAIISHRNYNPRLIQYITDRSRLQHTASETYHDFILKKLDKPEDIWRDPYEAQISEAAKFLLQTMFTLTGSIPEQQVQEAFNERVNFEVRVNGFQRESNLYHKTLRELLGGFIHRKAGTESCYLEFYNPSFADFMSLHLQQNEEETLKILRGLLFTEQLRNAFYLVGPNEQPYEFDVLDDNTRRILGIHKLEKVKVLKENALPIILERLEFLKPLKISKSIELNNCAFLLNNFSLELIDRQIVQQYQLIDFNSIIGDQFNDLFDLVLNTIGVKHTQSFEVIARDFDQIILTLFRICEYETDFLRIKDLFEKSQRDYEKFKDKHEEYLQSLINSFWKIEIDKKLNPDDLSEVYDTDTLNKELEKIYVDAENFNDEMGLRSSPEFDEIYKWDFTDLITENIRARSEMQYVTPTIEDRIGNQLSSVNLIENMFDGLSSSR
jgi:hypothetical protein